MANKAEGQFNEQIVQTLEECGRCGGTSTVIRRSRHFFVTNEGGRGREQKRV